MKLEKYSIKIEREALRINNRNSKSQKSFPKAFGSKDTNMFISSDEDDAILEISTPMENSIAEAYNKFEEIMNVVIEELYKTQEYIWPSSCWKESEEETTAKITIDIDEEFYSQMRELNLNLPETLEDAYLKMKEQFLEKATLIEKIYGKCKFRARKASLQISNIKLNVLNKNGISEADCAFLIGFAFGCLEEDTSKNLKEEIKFLEKLNNKYSLRLQNGLDEIKEKIKNKTFDNLNLEKENIVKLAKEHAEEGHNARYCLQKYQKLVAESVVLIKDAISQGIDYEVQNEAKSIVEFRTRGKEEFVIEGNKTDRDTYIFPIITDDKFTSKEIMQEHGLSVPKAILLEKDMEQEDIEALLKPFYNRSLVVKPRNTNYGTGITVFSKPASKKQIFGAVAYAFEFDNNVLIEEYVKGMEYRFLVVNGKCLSVAHRRIASVVGDGKSTIKELIEEKNKEPWHFLTGTPVKMDEPVVEYLKLQGYNFETILPKNKRVFLRTNSNCSTGGESIDMTDFMPSYFKKIAEKAARAFEAKICGVDIIIDDVEKEEYSIIEINDNPGYSINEWPYEGEGQKIGIAILKLLNLLPEKTCKAEK